MSATTTGAAAYRLTPVGVLRSEWTKMWSLRSTWYALAGTAALTLALGLLIGVTYQDGGDTPDPVELCLFGANFAQLILPVLGILASAGEWSSGLVRATMAAVPKRLPVLWAKASVFGTATCAVMLVTVLVTYPATQAFLGGTSARASFSDDGVARGVIGTAVAITLLGVLGLALGALLRSIAASIALFVGVVLVLPGLARLTEYDWIRVPLKYTPLNAAQPLMSAHPNPDLLSPATGLAVLVVWTVVLFAAAGVRLRRSDV